MLTLEDMIARVRQRTGYRNNDDAIIGEIQSASDWIFNWMVSQNADIFLTLDEELTLNADTHTYDLATNLSKTIYELKFLGVKFSGDTKFQGVSYVDSADPEFISLDQEAVGSSYPVRCDVLNFSQVRFAPGLPNGTILRVDYIYKPGILDIETNASPDLPEPYMEAVIDKATSQIFVNIDDTRVAYWDNSAKSRRIEASRVVLRRQFQQRPTTRPFQNSRGRGRW